MVDFVASLDRVIGKCVEKDGSNANLFNKLTILLLMTKINAIGL